MPSVSIDTFFACTLLVSVAIVATAFLAGTMQTQIGNMQDLNSGYGDAIFHFVMYFTSNYPFRPPNVSISTRVKNPMVSESRNECILCMDILERGFSRKDILIWQQVWFFTFLC